MSDILALFTQLGELAKAMELIAFGSENEDVTHDGKSRPTVSKALKERFIELQAMVQGRKTFETKSAMNAAGTPTADSDGNFPLAEVWNDNTAANNGVYGWSGSSWVKSKFTTENMQNISEFMSGALAGQITRQQVSGSFPVTGDWAASDAVLTWGVDSSGAINITASDNFTTPRFFKVGQTYSGEAAIFEITAQIDTNDSSQTNGCYMAIGQDANNYVSFLYGNNGALYVYDKQSNTNTSLQFDDVSYDLGQSATMRIELDGSGLITLVAIAPDGTVRSHSTADFSVPAGNVLIGWRKPGTGKIKKFKRLKFKDIPGSGVNALSNPDGRLGADQWIMSGSGMSIGAVSGGLKFQKESGSKQFVTTEREVPADASNFSYHLNVKRAMGDGVSARLLIIQYSDEGPGLISGANETHRIEVPESSPVESGYVFKGVAEIAPSTKRVVLCVGLVTVGAIEFTEACIAFGSESPEYVEPMLAPVERVLHQEKAVSGIEKRLTKVEADKSASELLNTERRAGVVAPDGFTFDDYGFGIYRGLVSGAITTNFNPLSKMIQTDLDIYIDSVTGSDGNAGSKESPLGSLAAAFALMNSEGKKATIYAAPGDYFSDAVGNLSGLAISQDFNLVSSSDSAPAVFIQGNKVSGWLKDSEKSNLWYVDVSGAAPLWAIDRNNRDEFGEEIPLTPKNIDDANSTPNSCYVVGQRIYVHLSDGREPDDDLIVLQDLKSLGLSDRLFYFRSIHFYGGNGGTGGVYLYHATGDSCVDNCRFSYAYHGNAFGSLRGRDGRLFLYKSVASYSRKLDGWNYHKGSASVASDVVEIECLGHHNGLMQSLNNNGTTMHDGGRVIRINCDFSFNMNRNVHDISDGTEVWMLGVSAGDAQTTDDDPYNNSNFMFGRKTSHDETKAWLDSCKSLGGSVSDFAIYPGSELRVRNTDVTQFKSNEVVGVLGAY